MGSEAQQRFRQQYRQQELVATGLEVQTVMYRSPEVLFNEQDYGIPIDSWSMGLILAEVNGWTSHRVRTRQSQEGRKAVIKKLLQLFRLPETSDLCSRPRMTSAPHEHATIRWNQAMLCALGEEGKHMLDGLLRWEPQYRWTAAEALAAKFLHPEAMALTGRPANILPSTTAMGLAGEASHAGVRHAWNMVSGCLSPDVLEWLRADPALQPGSEAWKELGVTFAGTGTALANTHVSPCGHPPSARSEGGGWRCWWEGCRWEKGGGEGGVGGGGRQGSGSLCDGCEQSREGQTSRPSLAGSSSNPAMSAATAALGPCAG